MLHMYLLAVVLTCMTNIVDKVVKMQYCQESWIADCIWVERFLSFESYEKLLSSLTLIELQKEM